VPRTQYVVDTVVDKIPAPPVSLGFHHLSDKELVRSVHAGNENRGFHFPWNLASKKRQNRLCRSKTPLLNVDLTDLLICLTNLSPSEMLTPASVYVSVTEQPFRLKRAYDIEDFAELQ